MNLAGMQRTEGAQKGLLDGLWCYAALTSEICRTVSEGEFCELRLYGSPEKVYEGAAPLFVEEPRPHTLLALSSRIYLVVRSQPQSAFY